jgi:hypothetical protein
MDKMTEVQVFYEYFSFVLPILISPNASLLSYTMRARSEDNRSVMVAVQGPDVAHPSHIHTYILTKGLWFNSKYKKDLYLQRSGPLKTRSSKNFRLFRSRNKTVNIVKTQNLNPVKSALTPNCIKVGCMLQVSLIRVHGFYFLFL